MQEVLEQVCCRSLSSSRQLEYLGFGVTAEPLVAGRSYAFGRGVNKQRYVRSDALPSFNKRNEKQIYPGPRSLRDNGYSSTSRTSKTSSPMRSCLRP